MTNDTRLLYCHLMSHYHLGTKLGRPAAAFARGLAQMVPLPLLRLFNALEFNELIGGCSLEGGKSGGIDIEDMKRHAKYTGGYSESSSTVGLFWKVVSGFNNSEVSALLKFVTSCSRAPLGGFRHLNPPFTIHKVECTASVFAVVGGKDVERLPSASTCYNMLKLPNYKRAGTMQKKLLYAINAGAGFELS